MERYNQKSASNIAGSNSVVSALDDAFIDVDKFLSELDGNNLGFKIFCDVAFEGIFLHDNSVAIMVNDQVCEMFGYQREELLGTNKIQDMIAPESQAFVRSQIASHAVGPYEAVGLRKDGTRFTVEVRVREILFEGKTIRVVSIIDFSDRQALEQKIEEVAYDERERLEQELHDGVCQNLVASSYLVSKIVSELENCESGNPEIARKVLALLQSSLIEVKNVGRSFHTIPATSSGLHTGLKNLASKISSFGSAKCSFVSEKVVLIPYKKELIEVYMIAREAAINAAKHAEASEIVITLAVSGDLFIVRVEDDGKAITKKEISNGAGMGLGIMQKRAKNIGATLDISQRPTGGTRIQCTFD